MGELASPCCAPQQPTTHRPGRSPSCLCWPGTCTRSPSRLWGWTLRTGAGRTPGPQNHHQHRRRTRHPRVQPVLSVSPPCRQTQQAWGQPPDPARRLPTHGLALRLASREETGNCRRIPPSQLSASLKTPHPRNPTGRGAAQVWGLKSPLGQPHTGPSTPGCSHVFLLFPCFVNSLSSTICPSPGPRRRKRHWQCARPAPGYAPRQFLGTIYGEGADAAPTSADGPRDARSAQGFDSERRRHCDTQARPELVPAAPAGCRRLPQCTGKAWGWVLKDWVGKG